jgi:MFS family permease
MPISGAIKSTFPRFDFGFDRLGAMGRLAAPFGLVALCIGLLLDRDPRRRVLWCGLGIGVIAHALYVVGFTDHYTFWAWYYVSGVLAAGLAIAYLPGWVTGWVTGWMGPGRARAAVRTLVLVVTFAVLTLGAARAWLKAFNPIELGPVTVDIRVNEYRWPEEFAAWMKEHLPPDSVVFVLDWPGALAWYSDLRVLPMDGLVSDFRYNDDLLAAGAEEYLCAHGVTHFFGLMDDGRAARELVVTAPLYRKPAGTLSLRAERLVVKTRDVVRRPAEALPFAVWQLDCPGR